MIVLGQKHTFTEEEFTFLQNNFTSIDYVEYKKENPQTIIQKIEQYLQANNSRIIILNTKASISDDLIAYLTNLELNGVKFITISIFLEEYFHKCYIHEDQTDISFLAHIKYLSPLQYTFKRFIDYTGVICLGLITFPVILYSIYRIKKESPDGSVFYIQQRVGINGKEFRCVKFRSMAPNAEINIPQFSSKGDPRIFKWGVSMRKRRIDELPQLWNILKGDMHLIGPRPERKYWVNQFEKEIPFYNERHIIKPGITGWAQTKYTYGNGIFDARQKLMYDLYYIKNWSIKLDILVLWRTIFVVLRKNGV